MNEQQTTIKEPENDPTGTETNERAQSGRTIMKKVKFWLVSPSNFWVKRLLTNDVSIVSEACAFIKNSVPRMNDLTICTNECATTFNNGLRFSNGKLYHI